MAKSIAIPGWLPLIARILNIGRYTVLEAWRNRFALLMVGIVIAAVLASIFVRQQAITEADRMQAVFLASALRVASVFVVAIYVLQGTLREYQDKVLELMLSLDLPRWSYLAGKFLGYAVVSLCCAVIVALPLLLVCDPADVLIWAYTLVLELWMVAAFALFCMTTLTQLLPAATFVLAFYLLARSITAIQLISESTLAQPGLASDFGALLADAIALLLPRLDAFTQTAWLINAPVNPLSLTAAAAQTAIYVALLLAAAMFDLHRRNF